MVLSDQVHFYPAASMSKTLLHHLFLKRGIEKTGVNTNLKSFSTHFTHFPPETTETSWESAHIYLYT